MKAPLLVDALRTRDPGAPAALYDTHGESLFRYCWFILCNRDAAQVALRDTLVLAEAHIGELRDPEMLRPWLYALARGECLRRQESPGAVHDAVIARPDQPDADRRLIAWQAVLSLDPAEREALDLTLRHGMDTGLTALAMGLAPAEVQRILDGSRVHLEHALAGEILARHGVHNCPERVAALQGWAGELTVPLRERLVQHATSCQVCGRYLPRNVSATKVYSLLPVPVPPQALRLRVMTCFTDPELVGYRMFVAARVTGFAATGFPGGGDAQAAPPRRAGAAWSAPAAAAVAVAVLVAAVFAIGKLGGFGTPVQGVSSASGSHSLAASPTVSLQQPGSGPAGTPPGHRAGSTGASAPAESARTGKGRSPVPLFLRATSGPVPTRKPSPGPSSPSPSQGHTGTGTPTPAGRLQSSPGDLSLGTGSTGQITLSATGGPVSWTASAPSDIALSSSGGTLAAGQQAVLTVTVSRSQQPSGYGTVIFTPGGGRVTVSWSSPASSSPPPPPSSSPAPTVVPPTPTATSPSRLPTPSTPPTDSSAPVPPPPPTPTPTPTSTPAPAPTPTQAPAAHPGRDLAGG